MKRSKKINFGFTLIELLIVVAIAAILMFVAVPSFREFLKNNELRSISNGLYNAMLVARNEAMTRNSHVLVIPYADSDWKTGWKIFVDLDRDNGWSSGDFLISDFSDIPENIKISTLNSLYIMYDGSGFSKQENGAPLMGTISVERLDNSYYNQVRRIKISNSGKARVCTPASTVDVNCSTSDSNN